MEERYLPETWSEIATYEHLPRGHSTEQAMANVELPAARRWQIMRPFYLFGVSCLCECLGLGSTETCNGRRMLSRL
jgi:hypothetical protein